MADKPQSKMRSKTKVARSVLPEDVRRTSKRGVMGTEARIAESPFFHYMTHTFRRQSGHWRVGFDQRCASKILLDLDTQK